MYRDVARLLPIAEGDSIPEKMLSKVEELQLSGLGIKSLKGIEFFTALTQINCSDNQLKEIDVSKNTALQKLECGRNQLTSIDIIRPANNPDLGKGTFHTWPSGLTLIWWQKKI